MEEQMVLKGLSKQVKEIPVSSLYDTQGSLIYEEITRLPDYYLFSAELQLLKENSWKIAEAINPSSLFVELGCGTTRKTVSLLSAIQHVHGRCMYVGIDVSESALEEARKNLSAAGLKPSAIELIHADFSKGLQQVKSCYPQQQLFIAWLGSSVGNVTKENAVEFFKEVLKVAGSTSQLLVCRDMWKNPETLYSAYHDKKGVFERFVKNGMQNALSCIGYVTDEDSVESWNFEVEINKVLRRVEMYSTFPQGLNLNKHQIQIRPGESILVLYSTKYSVEDTKQIATKACCQMHRCWGDSSYYTCQMCIDA